MSIAQLQLRTLRASDAAAFRQAVMEFSEVNPDWQFAFNYDPDGDFAEYVQRLERQSRGQGIQDGFVPATYFVGMVDGEIVGRVSMRHHLNDFLARIGGHVGYGVVPRFRRMGYATEMLRQAIPRCAAVGISRILITCDIDNVGSRKVIEACGGQFEGITNEPELKIQKRRYWIPLEAGNA